MLTKSGRIILHLYKNPNTYPSDISKGINSRCVGNETKSIKGLLSSLIKGGLVSHPDGYVLTKKGHSLVEKEMLKTEERPDTHLYPI